MGIVKTKGIRLYGKDDLRLEEFQMPAIKDNEILVSVVTDSICMSTWKLAKQGEAHKKAPENLAKNPVMIGHEFCGKILQVGKIWQDHYQVGSKYVVQANLQLPDRPDCPGYSYPYCGGDTLYAILPSEVMEQDCLLLYRGDTYFEGSLIEPLSCVVGAFNANYHLVEGSYEHEMGIKEGGNLLIMGGTGPMGLLAIDYALHGPRRPKTIVVTDRHDEKLVRAARLYPSEEQTTVHFVNVEKIADQEAHLRQLVGEGFDDIFIFAAVPTLVTLGSSLLAADGCVNFFAGPQDSKFSAEINFYDVHYLFTHYVGTSGGNTEDMRKAIQLIENKQIKVANSITHILGLNCVVETTLQQPEIGGGKKLVYTQKKMERIALADIMEDSSHPLAIILQKTAGIWSKEAEEYILKHGEDI